MAEIISHLRGSPSIQLVFYNHTIPSEFLKGFGHLWLKKSESPDRKEGNYRISASFAKILAYL